MIQQVYKTSLEGHVLYMGKLNHKTPFAEDFSCFLLLLKKGSLERNSIKLTMNLQILAKTFGNIRSLPLSLHPKHQEQSSKDGLANRANSESCVEWK